MLFATDDHGRRTDAWLGTNDDKASWAGHYRYGYNKDNQVIKLVAESGIRAGSPTVEKLVDVTYCYKRMYSSTFTIGIEPGADCTKDDASTVPSFSKLQWQKDHLTGKVTVIGLVGDLIAGAAAGAWAGLMVGAVVGVVPSTVGGALSGAVGGCIAGLATKALTDAFSS